MVKPLRDAPTLPANIWDVIFLEIFWCLCLKLKNSSYSRFHDELMCFLFFPDVQWVWLLCIYPHPSKAETSPTALPLGCPASRSPGGGLCFEASPAAPRARSPQEAFITTRQEPAGGRFRLLALLAILVCTSSSDRWQLYHKSANNANRRAEHFPGGHFGWLLFHNWWMYSIITWNKSFSHRRIQF